MTGLWTFRSFLLFAGASLLCETVAGRDLVVTEIAFDNPEFLELQNMSDAPLDLHGYTVFGGIDAFLTGVLAPGEIAVIVGDERSFRSRYGDGPRVLTEFERRLDNDGESLSIRDAEGMLVLAFAYRTSAVGWPLPWRDEYPLELIAPHDPETDLSSSLSWRRTFRDRGSPGRATDDDQDGLDDVWEEFYFKTLGFDADDDPDEDDLANGTERRLRISPTSADTDGDGLLDPHETMTGIYISPENTGTDPSRSDTDGDGLFDGQEIPGGQLGDREYGTDPNKADTDGDSFGDYDEVFHLGDPLDSLVGPQPPQILSFSCIPDEPRAGETIVLQWEIVGSEERHLLPLPPRASGISNYSSRMAIAPVRREVLINQGSVWRFDWTSTDYGEDWKDPAFDDGPWSAGLSLLGWFPPWHYYPIHPATVLPVPQPDEFAWTAAYFRAEFLMPDRLPGNRIEAAWTVTDGGAIYFDGKLETSVRMPDSFDRSTLATTTWFADDPVVFCPDPIGPGALSIAAGSHPGNGEMFSVYHALELSALHPSTGKQTFMLQAANPFGEAERELEFEILDDLPPMQAYSEWTVETIPADGELGEEARSETRDLDGDGLANLLEFLLGSDPFQRDGPPLIIEPVYSTHPTAQPGTVLHFLVSYPRHRNPANAGIRLEWSVDGITWTTLPTVFDPAAPHELSIAVLDDDRELVTCRVSPYPWRRPKLFRLRAVNAEQ